VLISIQVVWSDECFIQILIQSRTTHSQVHGGTWLKLGRCAAAGPGTLGRTLRPCRRTAAVPVPREAIWTWSDSGGPRGAPAWAENNLCTLWQCTTRIKDARQPSAKLAHPPASAVVAPLVGRRIIEAFAYRPIYVASVDKEEHTTAGNGAVINIDFKHYERANAEDSSFENRRRS
jgi:hypothetical protein